MLDGTPVAATPALEVLQVSSLQPLRQGTRHIGRGATSPVKDAACAPSDPPQSPHCVPVLREGNWWGINSGGGPGSRRAASAAVEGHPSPTPSLRKGAMPTPRPPVGGSEESKQKVDQEEQCKGRERLGVPPCLTVIGA